MPLPPKQTDNNYDNRFGFKQCVRCGMKGHLSNKCNKPIMPPETKPIIIVDIPEDDNIIEWGLYGPGEFDV